MKIFTSYLKTITSVACFILVSFSFSQNSGVWTTSGSGSSTTWLTTAGAINITASATNYGSGTSHTLNDFVNDTMGCNNSAYSDATIVGNPSLSIRHTFPNTAQITFNFSTAVENPVMHFDRLGGGQANNLTTSSLIKILTPGITFTELSENDVHFVTTPTTVGREAKQPYTSLPSNCGPPLAGTASGSVRLNGIFNTVTFEISMDASGNSSSINDRWEIAFSNVKNLTLDFDGVDDYINRSAFLGGKSEATMMTWFKLDNGFDGGEIMGQRNFRLYIDSNKELKAFIKTSTGSNIDFPDTVNLLENMWYHVALKFDGNTGVIDLYLNGNNIWNYPSSWMIGTTLNNDAAWNSDHDFEIGRNTELDNNYFEGSIYETRVYNKALTVNQLHRQINQEIENNSGHVRGTIIPKDIEGLSWNDLELYYKMDVLNTGKTPDESLSGVNGSLHNMRTNQERTAPLPYTTTTSCSGNWSSSSNWLHGSTWDITGAHPESAIVHIKGNIKTNSNHTMVGLILDSGSKLEVNGSSGLFNSWYLKLDGDIDLQNESQLIQTADSSLDVASAGSLERDQQGTKDFYTYNYWSSPVGIRNTTSNNNSYTLPDVLNDGSVTSTPLPITFVTGHNGSPGTPGTTPISIASNWVWKYANKLTDDYASWQHVKNTGTVLAGEGYTMKGVDNSPTAFTEEQNYIFNGKPNNSDITLTLSAGNDYLVGNPYASAIDAKEFILDNISDGAGRATANIIDGTLYFWDHFAGNTHVLREYQGGYATYNLTGGIKATSTDARINASGQVGTKIPQQYIPVSQGFFVTADAGGTVTFKNSQRIFKTEASDPSLFLKGGKTKSKSSSNAKTNIDTKQKIRLMLDSPKGYHRQILIGADTNATNGIDKGYDAVLIENNVEDLFWRFSEKNFVIQGVNNFNDNQIFPLGIKIDKEGLASIKIDDLENIDSSKEIYLHDKELNIYHNLQAGKYDVHLAVGEYLNRFEITFSKSSQTLNTDEIDKNPIEVYFSNEEDHVVVHNPNAQLIESVEMINILGQSLFKFDINSNDDYLKYKASQIKTGTYILKIKTEYGKLSKKILIK